MTGARRRVRQVLAGGAPDRPPLYDLVRNDAILSHFAGRPVTPDNGEELVSRVLPDIVDASRPRIRWPVREGEHRLADGRRVRELRWTTWTDVVQLADSAAYAERLRRRMEDAAPCVPPGKSRAPRGRA